MISDFIIKRQLLLIMNFIVDLIQLIKEKESVVCMGLDPRLDNKGEIPQIIPF